MGRSGCDLEICKFYYSNVVTSCMRVYTRACQVCGSQRTTFGTWFSSSTMIVLQIQL